MAWDSIKVVQYHVVLYELQTASNPYTSYGTGCSTNDLQQRTVARLKGDTMYKFRVRAKNQKGESG